MAQMIDRIVNGARRSLADSRGRPARVAAAPVRAGERDVAAEPSPGPLDAMSGDSRDGAAISPAPAAPAAPAAASSRFATAAQRLASWLSGPDETPAELDADGAGNLVPVAPAARRATGIDGSMNPRFDLPATQPADRSARDPVTASPGATGAAAGREPVPAGRSVAWTAQPAAAPISPATALRRPAPPAEAVGAVLAAARIESLPARAATAPSSAASAAPAARGGGHDTGGQPTTSMPSMLPAPATREPFDRTPRALEAPTLERDPGADRTTHAPLASAIVESPPVRLAPASRPPVDALSRPASAPELVIDHVDIRVITEPPSPPPAPEHRAPRTVTRSGAWSPAARHYLGRWS